jgi:putative transposase
MSLRSSGIRVLRCGGYHFAMVRYRRNRVDGGTYFFTVTLADRRSSALVDHVSSLRTAFRVARQERPFALDAIVILPDHLHAILTLPEGDANFAGRRCRIKGHFSTGLLVAGIPISRHGNGELALWQRRFWEHTVRDERDFARHVDYIHYNPVKHGLVTRVADWLRFIFSSLRSPRVAAARLGRRCWRECSRVRRAVGRSPRERKRYAGVHAARPSRMSLRLRSAHPGYAVSASPSPARDR